MPTTNNYRINFKGLSNILEIPANRETIKIKNLCSGIPSGYSGDISSYYEEYAMLDPLYHPFTIDTRFNNYFRNESTNINKNCAPIGYAPLTRKKIAFSTNVNNTYNLSYTSGNLIITASDGSIVGTVENCQKTFILVIQGAGGGGAGGASSGSSMGGGCGAVLILNVELPTSDKNNFISLKMGIGGSGGSPDNPGGNGENSTIYFGDTYVATITGGRGGYICPGNKDFYWEPSTPYTSKEYCAFDGCDISETLKSGNIIGSYGEGRIAINTAMRNYRPTVYRGAVAIPGPESYLCIPGLFYGAYNNSYSGKYLWAGINNQSNISLLPVITSGTSTEYNKIIPNIVDKNPYYVGGGGKGYSNHDPMSYSGINSIFGAGGKYGEVGTIWNPAAANGTGGLYGAGGGAGGRRNMSWDPAGTGGKGGNAVLAIYF